MDPRRFDELTALLGKALSRRAGLGAALTAALAGRPGPAHAGEVRGKLPGDARASISCGSELCRKKGGCCIGARCVLPDEMDRTRCATLPGERHDCRACSSTEVCGQGRDGAIRCINPCLRGCSVGTAPNLECGGGTDYDWCGADGTVCGRCPAPGRVCRHRECACGGCTTATGKCLPGT
ncbi:MAG: hypothetical protein ACKOWF_11055, partial [Chloroflexota bacterium]